MKFWFWRKDQSKKNTTYDGGFLMPLSSLFTLKFQGSDCFGLSELLKRLDEESSTAWSGTSFRGRCGCTFIGGWITSPGCIPKFWLSGIGLYLTQSPYFKPIILIRSSWLRLFVSIGCPLVFWKLSGFMPFGIGVAIPGMSLVAGTTRLYSQLTPIVW